MNGIRDAVAFEWTKLRTLRSTWWTLVTFVVVSTGTTTAMALVRRRRHGQEDAGGTTDLDLVTQSFSGLHLGLVAIVVLGVLSVTGEYTNGSIRSSLLAVPRRGVLYTAKLLTVAAVTAAATAITVVAGGLVVQGTLGDVPHSGSLLSGDASRLLLGAVLHVTILCVLTMGLAALLRSPVVAMGILLPLFSLVSTVLNGLPGVRAAAQFLPDVAGALMMTRHMPDDTVLNAWSGGLVAGAWAAVAVAAGYLALSRRGV